MSELIGTRNAGKNFKWQLLATVSAVALLAAMCGANEAEATDQEDSRPSVWIELGGQLEQMQGGSDRLAPPFVSNLPNTLFSLLGAERAPQYSFGGAGAISFEPEGSDWVFSAAVRFGRSNGNRQQHQQTPNAKIPVHFTLNGKYRGGYALYPANHVKFEDAKAQRSEAHAILDFQVGKDVGLGMFGRNASSIISAGIRIAQFTSKTNVQLHAEPDVRYPTTPISSFQEKYSFVHSQTIKFHDYAATLAAQRSFSGLGPSIAWSGSAPFAGDVENGEVTLDWGANASVLFGRQKARGHHQTSALGYSGIGYWESHLNSATASLKPGYFQNVHINYSHHNAGNIDRMRTVIVPNLGGMAGLSFRYSNAKVSLGYRADFFFGAMDEGLDSADRTTIGFNGPFASVSIGLGG